MRGRAALRRSRFTQSGGNDSQWVVHPQVAVCESVSDALSRYYSNVCSIAVVEPSQLAAALDALDAAVQRLAELPLGTCAPAVRLRALERLETARRRHNVISQDLIHTLADEDRAELGGPAHQVIADTLRITGAEARRRIRNAAQVAPRLTLTGQQLPPELPATAVAWRHGRLDEQHLQVIATFMRDLPEHTAAPVAERAERFLAEHATTLRPDQLDKVAQRYALLLNPDGRFSETDRRRRRGFTWSPQRRDGMSVGKLTATPDLRAHLDAWLARFAAPGICNPDDQTPCVDGAPNDDNAARDLRSHAQRQHDALYALVRSQLGDPALGQHNGLPVTVIVSTTLAELRNTAGQAVTAAGTLLPIRDLIRLAGAANHYLAVFDDHQARPLYLGRAKRLATADQRIVLHASDRGCSFPGCDVPGYLCEAHHIDDWAHGGPTDIDNFTFNCRPHHKLHDHGWRTVKQPDGSVQWSPPPNRQLPGGTNTYHHPERLLPDDGAG